MAQGAAAVDWMVAGECCQKRGRITLVGREALVNGCVCIR